MFSLGSTLYAAVEGQPPFGTGGNTFQLLNLVRNGIIRPPTCAGPLEPLLLRLLQVNPATRPDAATTRDMLAQLCDPTPGDGGRRSQPTPRRPLRWWPPRRRAVITAGALLSVAAVVSVLIGALVRTDRTEQQPPPATAAAPADTGDPRQADPCALINLDSLRRFGQPQLTTPPFLESCAATITAGGNAETYLQVILYQPGESVSELGESQQVSGLPVVRKDHVGVEGTTGCQDWIAPAGQPWVTITTFPYRDGSEDLCAVTEAATTVAAETIARNGGVPAEQNRNVGYSLALTDACTILDNTALTKVPGLDPSKRSPGFANWSCFWGTADDDTRVALRFGLRESFDGLGEPSIPIAGKTTYRVSQPGNCDIYVSHRPAADVAEIFFITVSTSLPDVDACDLATDLATAGEGQLRRNPRNADPCALLNLDALRPFGEPRLTTGPWMASCQANIETINGDDIKLRVIFENPEPVSELKGTPVQLGERTLVRAGTVPYWGTEACRNRLVLGADQPMITINTLTQDGPVDLCAVTEAATTAAVEALDRDGGIKYSPERTALYSYAHIDACALLDNAILATVPGLKPNGRSPGYGNWVCHWHTKDENHGLSLLLRLEEAILPDFYEEDLQNTTIAGKQAFLDDSEPQRCDAHVVHRSTPTATEMLEIQVEAPLAGDELCTLATEKRLS